MSQEFQKIYSTTDVSKILGQIQASQVHDKNIIEFAEKSSAWSKTTLENRMTTVLQLIDITKKTFLEHATLYSEETGRSLLEINQEADQISSWKKTITENTQHITETQGAPSGPTLIVSSMVWPVAYSIGYAAMSLLAGNQTWIKGSLVGSLTLNIIIESISKSIPGLPLGLHVGDEEQSRASILHPDFSHVVFFGSTETGCRIRQDLIGQPFKELSLNMGARNLAWVTEGTLPTDLCRRSEVTSPNKTAATGTGNTDQPQQLIDILFHSSLLCMGHHCRSVNVVLVHTSNFSAWRDAITQLAKDFPIGGVDTKPNSRGHMAGALPHAYLVDRYLKWIGMIERDGANILMRGKTLKKDHDGNFVTPTIATFDTYSPDKYKSSIVQQTELLGPVLQIIPYSNNEEAIQYFSNSHYGLNALVLDSKNDDTSLYNLCAQLPVGLVSINKSTLDAPISNTLISRKKSGAGSVQGIGLYRRFSRKTFLDR